MNLGLYGEFKAPWYSIVLQTQCDKVIVGSMFRLLLVEKSLYDVFQLGIIGNILGSVGSVGTLD